MTILKKETPRVAFENKEMKPGQVEKDKSKDGLDLVHGTNFNSLISTVVKSSFYK